MTSGLYSSSNTLRFEYTLDEPTAEVWRALTVPELVARWLMPSDIRAEVGAKFTFRAEPTPWWDGVVHCEVLEVVQHERLVYTWHGSPQCNGQTDNDLKTIVAWTLTANERGGTNLLLEHSGFEPDSFVMKAMGNGWSGKIAVRLRDVLQELK